VSKDEVTRRDFLGATLLGAGASLLDGVTPAELLARTAQARGAIPTPAEEWNGFGGVGDYRFSNGNTWEVLTAGHKMRDGVFTREGGNVIDTGETYDCVVIGGGISGIAAALFFQRLA